MTGIESIYFYVVFEIDGLPILLCTSEEAAKQATAHLLPAYNGMVAYKEIPLSEVPYEFVRKPSVSEASFRNFPEVFDSHRWAPKDWQN